MDPITAANAGAPTGQAHADETPAVPARVTAPQLRQARVRRAPFALVLTGTALQPRYCNGDKLTVCPARPPAPGDAIVAQLGGPHGGITAVMILNGDGDLYDLRGGFAPRGEYTVVGVVTSGYPSRVGT